MFLRTLAWGSIHMDLCALERVFCHRIGSKGWGGFWLCLSATSCPQRKWCLLSYRWGGVDDIWCLLCGVEGRTRPWRAATYCCVLANMPSLALQKFNPVATLEWFFFRNKQWNQCWFLLVSPCSLVPNDNAVTGMTDLYREVCFVVTALSMDSDWESQDSPSIVHDGACAFSDDYVLNS